MKAGDLVELSAYGKKLKMFKKQCGLVGLVREALYDHIEVLWHGQGPRPVRHRRKDIKKVK